MTNQKEISKCANISLVVTGVSIGAIVFSPNIVITAIIAITSTVILLKMDKKIKTIQNKSGKK